MPRQTRDYWCEWPSRLAMRRLLCALLFIAPSAAAGQAPATIHGVARDESGGLLPGVTIVITSGAMAESAVTRSNGAFELPLVPTARLNLEARLSGFITARTWLDLRSGTRAEWNPVLRPWPVMPDRLPGLIANIVGASALSCGTHEVGVPIEAIQGSMACVSSAREQRRTAFMVQGGWGIDSRLAKGFLLAPDGRVSVFAYDSGPCVTAAIPCGERFEVRPCSAPSVAPSPTEPGWADFRCVATSADVNPGDLRVGP